MLRNVPIRCRVCSSSVQGQEYPITESSGRKVMNCVWRCNNCSTFNKQGITSIIAEPPQKNN